MLFPETDDAERPLTKDVAATLVGNHRDFWLFLSGGSAVVRSPRTLLHDAFIKSLDRLDKLRQGESAVAWFYRILRNATVDHFRRQGTRDRTADRAASELGASVEPDAEINQAICGCVTRLADTLKPEYAEALRRIEVDGLSVQQFASEAGITSNNAAVHVFRARDALRKRVVASCGTCAPNMTSNVAARSTGYKR